MESVRKYHAYRREERLRERLAYHEMMLEAHTKNFEEILRRHRVGIRLVEQELGITIGEGGGGCIVDGTLRRF